MTSINELVEHCLYDWAGLSFKSVCHEYELALELNLSNEFFL